MHLWPSMRIRDSFKIAYLKKLEWNIHRMESEKKQQSQQSSSNREKLLDNDNNNNNNNNNNNELENGVVDGKITEKDTAYLKNSCLGKSALIFREILLVLTCCYCCFCCGACVSEDED